MIRLQRNIFTTPRSTPALVWSPTDHYESNTISADGSTATRNTTLLGNWSMARSDTAQTSGVRYVEFTILQIGSGGSGTIGVGLANGAAAVNNFAGVDNNGIAYQAAGNVIKNSLFTGASPPSFTTGDVLGMVVDLDLHTVKFNKNGGAFSATSDITTLGTDVFVACNLGNGSTFSSVQIAGR